MPRQWTKNQQQKQFLSTTENVNSPSNQKTSLDQSCQLDPDTESILLQYTNQGQKNRVQSMSDVLSSQRKDSSPQSKCRDSLHVMSKQQSSNSRQQKSLLSSIIIDDSGMRQNLKSEILAHYKFDQNNEIQKIDVKVDDISFKKASIKRSISKNVQQHHWQPIQIPDSLFDQPEMKEDVRTVGQSQMRVVVTENVGQRPHKNVNDNMIPSFLQFIKPPGQQQSRQVSSTWHPYSQQPLMRQNHQQPQNSGFLHPSMTNQQNNQHNFNNAQQNNQQNFSNAQQGFNNGFLPMQFSQTAHYVPPCSPRSESYWQPIAPHPQLPPQYSHPPPPYYMGGELGNEMRYLRQQLKMLRDIMREQRADKETRVRYKSESESREFSKQIMFLQMKNMLQNQRKQHQKHIDEISSKFIDQIQGMKLANEQLKQQNQRLRRNSLLLQQVSPKKSLIRQVLTQDFQLKTDRKMSNLDTLTSKNICNADPFLNRKVPSVKKKDKKEKVEKTPRHRKLSENKISDLHF